MFKNILIPTDGSELSQRAVRAGVELAKLHRRALTGIHVIPDYHLLIAYEGAFDPVTEERIEEEAKARAEPTSSSSARRRRRGNLVRHRVRDQRSPLRCHPERGGSNACDLIVMTSHGRKGLAAVLLERNAESSDPRQGTGAGGPLSALNTRFSFI